MVARTPPHATRDASASEMSSALQATLAPAVPCGSRSTTTATRAHPSAAAPHAHAALSARFATASPLRCGSSQRSMRARAVRAVRVEAKGDAEEGEEEMMIEEMAVEKFEKSLDALETNLTSVRATGARGGGARQAQHWCPPPTPHPHHLTQNEPVGNSANQWRTLPIRALNRTTLRPQQMGAAIELDTHLACVYPV